MRKLILLTTLIAFGASSELCAQQSAQGQPGPTRPRTPYEDLQLLSGVLNQLRVNHPDSFDTHELMMAAIRGLVNAADPHSYLITAVRLNPQKERELRARRLVPVPIEFRFFGGAPVVRSIAAGSSAARTDILPGDELVAIEGKAVLVHSDVELEILLAGPRNSSVVLTLERRRSDGSLVQLTRAVKRERVADGNAVPAVQMLDAQTGYVRITTFAAEKVAEDLRAALRRLEGSGMQRLLLDLRDNGGGSLDESARVAGEFLPTGSVVYTAEGRKKDVADTGRVRRGFWASEKRYPIVVMVNSGTASASELVAGALQDHDRALIVGQPSFGKSLMMRGFPLPDGSVLVMVVGHVKTPCGRVVQRQYQDITRRDYYRMARAERDTANRPTCRTTGGRTVFGGGGIYPDIVMPDPEARPTWYARLYEDALFLKWVGGYAEANSASYPNLAALVAKPVATPGAVAEFRRFAEQQGARIPAGEDADRLLERAIVRNVAVTKWGEEGLYRVIAVTDPEVMAALRSFDKLPGALSQR